MTGGCIQFPLWGTIRERRLNKKGRLEDGDFLNENNDPDKGRGGMNLERIKAGPRVEGDGESMGQTKDIGP